MDGLDGDEVYFADQRSMRDLAGDVGPEDVGKCQRVL